MLPYSYKLVTYPHRGMRLASNVIVSDSCELNGNCLVIAHILDSTVTGFSSQFLASTNAFGLHRYHSFYNEKEKSEKDIRNFLDDTNKVHDWY